MRAIPIVMGGAIVDHVGALSFIAGRIFDVLIFSRAFSLNLLRVFLIRIERNIQKLSCNWAAHDYIHEDPVIN